MTSELQAGHVPTTLSIPQTISTVSEYFSGPSHQALSTVRSSHLHLLIIYSLPTLKASSVDTMSSADEGLADLQPEDSDGEEDERTGAKATLSPDQKVKEKNV